MAIVTTRKVITKVRHILVYECTPEQWKRFAFNFDGHWAHCCGDLDDDIEFNEEYFSLTLPKFKSLKAARTLDIEMIAYLKTL